MKADNIQDIYELSSLQQGILFHSLYAPESAIYFVQRCYSITGNLNVVAFEQAWRKVVTHHSILRTAFYWENLEKPLQVVHKQVTVSLLHHDWRGINANEHSQQLQEFLEKDRALSFDFSQPCLMRLHLIRYTDDSYYFVWSKHHLILDGWSTALILKEVVEIYQSLCLNEKLPLISGSSFGDYIGWLQQQDLSKAQTFWQQSLEGVTAPTPLINLNLENSSKQAEIYNQQFTKLTQTTTAALQSFAQQNQLTLNTLIQAAYALVLSRYSRETNVVYGVTVSGRPADLVKAESMVGMFINTLPVRVSIDSEDSLLTWLKKLQSQLVEIRQYEYSPLVDVQGWSEVPRGLPLFESILVFENYPIDTGLKNGMRDLEIQCISSVDNTNYPLTFICLPGAELELRISYNRHRFDSDTISRMLGHITTLLENMITNVSQPLASLAMLTAFEKHQLLVDFNNTQIEYSQNKCIHQLFEEQVEKTPDAVAVVFEELQLTYSELNQKANQLAHYLQYLGVKPETLVGIYMERSTEMVIAILAIMKAGGAYLPLDPTYPKQRLALMLEDAQVSLLLTQSHLIHELPAHQAQVININPTATGISGYSEANPVSDVQLNNAAYIIYTSGSTGIPKGVINTHQGLCNRLLWMQHTYQLNESDIVLQKTPFSFDVSVWEFFWPLFTGATLVVAKPGGHQDANYLVQIINQQQITTLHFVPSMLEVFLQEPRVEKCDSVKRVICSGEALPLQLQKRFFELLDAELHNLYGPTEAAIDVTAWKCQKNSNQKIVPIGYPIANTQIYILDKYLQPVPIGVPGELHIGGVGLARGYLHRPELTKEKFIDSPFEPEKRLYKTGDLARYLPNGSIEYLGRIDYQVKIRGFRIETGEIEAAITQHPSIRQVVVLAREDILGDRQLVAYVVPHPQHSITTRELRNFLKDLLPSYMVPNSFVILLELPLLPNGKINRDALPVPATNNLEIAKAFVPPHNVIEDILAGIWAKTLRVKQVGIHDNFFELGGHSLLATQIISRIREAFRIELPLRCLFESPTVAQLSQAIIAKEAQPGQTEKMAQSLKRFEEEGTNSGVVSTIPLRKNTDKLELSFAQKRLWILNQLEPSNPFYNIPAALKIKGQLDINALQSSFHKIIERHEILRTNFTVVDGQPVLIISPKQSINLSIIDLRALSAIEREAEAHRLTTQEFQRPFDLTSEALLRVTLLQLEDAEYILLLTMHHIVSDGWSTDVLVREVTTLYKSLTQGETAPLPKLPIQYTDYAIWQRQWLQGEILETQLNYWKQQLAGNLPILELPTDRPRPKNRTYRGAKQYFQLSPQLSLALKTLSQQRDCSLFMTLLAAFKVLLYRYTSTSDIVVGSPIANRNRIEIEGLIGFFVNTLVLRTNLSDNPTFEELLSRIKDCTLSAYAHQDLPFDVLVEELQPQRSLSHAPLFQVMFILQNAPTSEVELPGLTVELLKTDSGNAKFDLTLLVQETDSGIQGAWEYNSDLFEAATISRMGEHFQILLEGIVANQEQRITELPLLTQQEQQQILVDWNNTSQDYLLNKCIHQLFEEQVEQTPDAVAVVFENQQLTYQELNQRAKQLANYLQQLGITPEVLVGICVDRSLEMVIGILGILKAGGAYVPIDPSYPQERLDFMLKDAQLSILITKQNLVVTLPSHQAQIVYLDSDWEKISQHRPENLTNTTNAKNLAYVIYTSGSTGKPKGVKITHTSVVNFLTAMRQTPGLTQADILLSVTTLSFDIAVLELYLPLIVGARVVLVSREVAADGIRLLKQLTLSQATVMQATPTTWRMLVVAGWEGNPQLKVLCGGEALDSTLANQLRQRSKEVWNLYGPTETTIWSSVHKVENTNQKEHPQGIISIGRPIANTQFYILDQNQQLVPVGVIGELHIGGAGLARGYLNRPELTQEKFIINPFYNPQPTMYVRMTTGNLQVAMTTGYSMLYKTGDLARYLPNGELEYISRIDNQTKLRGFRIELGEIEATINEYPGISTSVVVLRQEESGNQTLVAYFTLNSHQTLAIFELRRFLESKLPNYMIPSAFVTLEALPLTPNGKVDRKALPAPENFRPELEVTYSLPKTEAERTIANIWQQVLNLERIGIHDNFFELGGHSLLLITVHNRLREIFLNDLSTLDLFRYPTISSLAEYLSTSQKQTTSLQKDNIQTNKILEGKAQQKKRLQTMKKTRS